MAESSETREARPTLQEIFLSFWKPQLGPDFEYVGNEERRLLNNTFNLWKLKIVVLVANLVGTFIWLIVTAVKTDVQFSYFVFALLWLIVVPLMFHTWYRTLSSALITNKASAYRMFFLVFGIHCVVAVLWVFGAVGTIGLYLAWHSFRLSPIVSFIFYGLTVLYVIYAALAILLLLQVHHHYQNVDLNAATSRSSDGAPIRIVIEPKF